MMHFIFDTIWGWWGVAGIVVIVCAALSYVFPQFRVYALAVVGVVISCATIYSKGSRDRAALEARRKEEAVRKAQKEYADIDARPDTPKDVIKRMRNNGF